MNINCALVCTHQKDGKCCLQKPKTTSLILLEETSCPFYEKTIPRSRPRH